MVRATGVLGATLFPTGDLLCGKPLTDEANNNGGRGLPVGVILAGREAKHPIQEVFPHTTQKRETRCLH